MDLAFKVEEKNRANQQSQFKVRLHLRHRLNEIKMLIFLYLQKLQLKHFPHNTHHVKFQVKLTVRSVLILH